MIANTIANIDRIKAHIKDVHDFPKPGVIYKDITPLLGDQQTFFISTFEMQLLVSDKTFTKVVAIDSRGFIFGAPIALEYCAGFVPVRKKGKLPRETYSIDFDLEYNSTTIEMHSDALNKDDKVLIVDDVLATGGTLAATKLLIEQTGAEIVGAVVLIELKNLDGRSKLGDMEICSLIKYE